VYSLFFFVTLTSYFTKIMKPLNRRQFLTRASATSLAVGAGLVPWRQLMASTSGLNFVFVFNGGGWDPTRVFANCFEQRAVDMEVDAGVSTFGNLSFVDHEDRPSVRAFFEQFHASSLIVNGLLCPSVAHSNCARLMMTGTSNDGASDWGAIIAGQSGSALALPELVLSGPSFPGLHGTAVTRTGTSGQFEALLSGDVIEWSDLNTRLPHARAEDRMDDYMLRRAAAAIDNAKMPRAKELYQAYNASLERAVNLKDLQGIVDWSATGDLSALGKLTADLLQLGICRCVMMNHSGRGWDTHTNNDTTQSQSWESLFSGLLDMSNRLAALPGKVAPSLLDETVIVVLSEMGRTPALNDGEGKDHWPYTSAMVMGAGITGDRVVGATDEFYYGKTIDPDSGDLYAGGVDLTVGSFGATLLNLAGIEHEPYLSGVPAISGLLR
jgi:uncharacterized protein (DUF1501 family)